MEKISNHIKSSHFSYKVLTNNTYYTRTPAIHSTGFRTPTLKYHERESLTNLAELFLINSYLCRNDPEIENSISSYLNEEGTQMISLIGEDDLSAYQTIPLGDGISLDLSLSETIMRRRSVRDFTGDPLHFDFLTSILRATAGVSAIAETRASENQSTQFRLRTVPSGGGLYPVELYIAALNVNGLQSGLYLYHSTSDQLIVLGEQEQLNAFLQSFSAHHDLVCSSHASVVFLYIAKPWRTMRKYGIRGLRFVLQEIGSMSQNTHLAAAAIGLGSVDCASFFENEANKALSLDGVYQTLLHSVLLGTTS